MFTVESLRRMAAAGPSVSPYLKELAGRTPPSSVRCEFAVSGACLHDPQRIPEVRSLLEPEMFSDPVARGLYAVLVSMHDAHLTTDLTTFIDYVAKHELSDLIGGYSSPIFAQQMCAAPANARHYAMEVRRAFASRESANACADAAHRLADGASDTTAVVAELRQRLTALGDMTAAHDGPTVGELADSIMARWDAEPDTLETPWRTMTEMTMGWERNTLTIIGAAPSVGKTAMLTQIARSAAAHDQPTLFVSLEMSESAIVARLVSQISGAAYRQVISGDMTAAELKLCGEAMAWLHDRPLTIRTPHHCTAGAIDALIRSFPGTRIVCIDFIQLIAGAGDNRAQQIGNVVHTLKRTAVETGCTVVAASQLNRAAFDTAGGRPELHNLRESGDIEAAADVVVLLWRDKQELIHGGTTRRYCRVAKNRNGPTGDIPMVFNLKGARWEERSA